MNTDSASNTPFTQQLRWDQLLAEFEQRDAWVELLCIAGCLVLAWFAVRALRGRRDDPQSIFFGRQIFDGVAWPVVSLILLWLTQHLLIRWELSPALVRLATAVMLAFSAIRLTSKVLTAAFPRSRTLRWVERLFSWLAWLAVVIWLTGFMPQLLQAMDDVSLTLGSSRLTLRNILEGTLSVGFMLMAMLWLSQLVEARLLKGVSGSQLSVRMAVANLTRTVLILIGVIVALSVVGIDLTALSVLGGAIGVGIGFGLQKVAANYISGFVILAERSVRIGDMVRVEGFEGQVSSIATRYTVLRSASGNEAIVPNEMLITNIVENLSLSGSSFVQTTTVSVAYGTDIPALKGELIERIKQVPRVLQEPSPGVNLAGFGADGLDLSISYSIADPQNGQGNVRSDVNLVVLDLLNERGIDIPYPQRVVKLTGQVGQGGGSPVAA